MGARVEQSIVEILDDGSPSARAEQSVVEVLVNYIQIATPLFATIALTSEAPTLNFVQSATPTEATIQITCYSPAVSLLSVQVVVAGAVAELELTGFAPTLISYEVGAAAKRHTDCGHWHAGQTDDPAWNFALQNNLDFDYHKHNERPRVCGHWHRTVPPTLPCIEYVSELSVSATEASGQWASNEALILHADGFLYGGDSASGEIFQIERSSLVKTASTTFSGLSGIFQIEIDSAGDLLILCTLTGYSGKWIQKVTLPSEATGNEFVLSGDALYCGTVVLGTDGKKYGCLKCLGLNTFWRPEWQPITGSIYENGVEQLPDGYSGMVWNDFDDYVSDTGVEVSFGSTVVNFKLSHYGYLLNCGPESSFLAYSAFPFEITTGGDFVRVWGPTNSTIGPAEAVRIDEDNFALTTAWPNWKLSLRTLTVPGTVLGNYYDFPLEDENGDSVNGQALYQSVNRYCSTNGYVYSLNASWPDFTGRIVALDPVSGTLVHQFVFGDGLTLNYSAFIIVGEFVYVWQNVLGNLRLQYCAIVKLTLSLELVCIENCSGQPSALGNPLEIGGMLASDGTYIYNFNKSGDSVHAVTKYRIAPSASTTSAHDPRWDFEKQPDKW